MRIIFALLCLFGCSTTFRASTIQPNPLAHPLDTLRVSEKITIVTGDMDLETPDQPGPGRIVTIRHNRRFPLYNTATFSIVSKDRLRFHVQIDHKWEEYADLNTWAAYIIDDQGRRWYPESTDRCHISLITKMWDREIQTATYNQYGDVVRLNQDGWRNRQSLGSMTVYRGHGDFVFVDRDIFSQSSKSLKLVLKRGDTTFEFTWIFSDG